MKITKRQLRRIIKEEKTKILNEQWGNSESSSPLIQFAQAWAGLGGAVQEQVSSIIEAYHNSGGVGDQRFDEAVYDQNPNAIDMAMQRLGPALRLGELGDEGDAILEALTEAQDLFEREEYKDEAEEREA
jgi:hypothetical protein